MHSRRWHPSDPRINHAKRYSAAKSTLEPWQHIYYGTGQDARLENWAELSMPPVSYVCF